jgi:hypothetical protein
MSTDQTLAPARTPNGLHARSFLRGATLRSRMWREVGRTAAAGGQRVPRELVSSVGPPPNWSFRLRCCRHRMTSVHSRGPSVSRWQNWIRAWDSGEASTTHSAAQAVECAALSCSRVSWTSQVGRPLHPGLSRLRGCMTGTSTRLHALRRMAILRLKRTLLAQATPPSRALCRTNASLVGPLGVCLPSASRPGPNRSKKATLTHYGSTTCVNVVV